MIHACSGWGSRKISSARSRLHCKAGRSRFQPAKSGTGMQTTPAPVNAERIALLRSRFFKGLSDHAERRLLQTILRQFIFSGPADIRRVAAGAHLSRSEERRVGKEW